MLALPVVGLAGVTAKGGADHFLSLPANLTVPPLAQPSRILDAAGNEIAVLRGEQDREIVGLDKVPPQMRQAIIDIEDARFYEHTGVDYRGMIRAYLANQESGGVTQGGSTLTQQYVKNVLLASARTPEEKAAAIEQTVDRKLREARYALYLEEHLAKDEILERYLNIAYFGDGAYGIQAAARHYFNIDVSQLSVTQSAMLAGLVKNPTAYNPVLHPQAARERRNTVLDRMHELGDLDAAAWKAGRAEELVLNRPARSPDACEDSSAAFFCSYVRQVLLADRTFAATPEDARRLLFEGGLTIRTTLDPVAQGAAQTSASEVIPTGNRVAAGVAMVQPGTGNVLALAVNREYGTPVDDQPPALTTDFVHTKEIYPVDPDSFSPGSTFKVFTLAAALENNIPLSTTFHSPLCYHSDRFPNPDPDGKNCYSNADPSEDGFYSLTTATWNSVNTYYIQLAERLGVMKTAEMARRLGVSSCRIRPNDENDPECKGVEGIGPVDGSAVLGSNEISTLDLATAYATLAARGNRCYPRTVLSITQRVGTADRPLAFNTGKPCEQVLAPGIADTVTSVLEGVINHGTASGNGQIGRPAAGKTGTAEGFSTASFAGFIPQLATAVTLADPRGPTTHQLRNVLTSRQVFGGGFPAQVWARTMTRTIDGLALPVMPLPAPDNTQPQVPKKALPDVRGQTQQAAEYVLRSLGFRVRSETVPHVAPPGIVVGMAPGPGEISVDTEVVLQVSGGLTGAVLLPNGGGVRPGQPVAPPAGDGRGGIAGLPDLRNQLRN
ncbi:penicillin-binding protein [Parafrankia discariae]|uniref:penicillin-binding protein n=1 Tax=Parafrankia discariae TaxID=365528 RepID=UPI000687B03F|nr:penicillin-binding protein [Parafrankia discariae]